jgi:hypothetical protein
MKYLLIALLAGCAQQQPMLYNPYKTPAMAQQDNLECRYEAMKVEATVQNAAMGVFARQDAMRMCLQVRGYK